MTLFHNKKIRNWYVALFHDNKSDIILYSEITLKRLIKRFQSRVLQLIIVV